MENLNVYGVQEMIPVEIKQTSGGFIRSLLGWALGEAIDYADWSIFRVNSVDSTDRGIYTIECDNV